MPGSVPQTGTVATPVQTAGLSAVPGQVTYKTSYAGTQGAVPQTIVTSTPGSGEQIASGYQQVQYINPQTNQTIIVTEFNGNPITYIPPGFVRQTPMAEQQQQLNNQHLSLLLSLLLIHPHLSLFLVLVLQVKCYQE